MHLVYKSRCDVHMFAFIIEYSCMHSTLHHQVHTLYIRMHGLLKCQIMHTSSLCILEQCQFNVGHVSFTSTSEDSLGRGKHLQRGHYSPVNGKHREIPNASKVVITTNHDFGHLNGTIEVALELDKSATCCTLWGDYHRPIVL